MKRFLILGLPRSRTAWLANFLTTDRSFCDHDASGQATSFESVFRPLSRPYDYHGVADTGLAVLGDSLPSDLPIVLIVRPFEEAYRSTLAVLPKHDPRTVRSSMEAVMAGLGELRPRAALVFPYEDLEFPSVVREIQRVCMPTIPWDPNRYELLRDLRVVVNPERCLEQFSQDSIDWLRAGIERKAVRHVH